MDELSKLLMLSEEEKATKGVLYTPREIFQQPASWRRSFERFQRRAGEVREFLARIGIGCGKEGRSPIVFMIGAGTSDYTGRAVSALLRQQWQCQVEAVASTDLLTNAEDYLLPGEKYLWVSFSRSGDSSEGVAVIEAALDRHPEIQHLIITCNGEGRMAREFGDRANVYCLVLDDEVNDRGLAMTSSFTNMIVTGHCLAHFRDLAVYEAILEQLTTAGQKFLGAAADAAARLTAGGLRKVCFLGTGPLRAVAIESALKVVELTAGGVYTWSESYLGVRHGPLSAVDDETLIVGYISGDTRRRSYESDLLGEVRDKRLATHTITIWPAFAPRSDPAHDAIELEFEGEVADFYRPPVDVIFGQLCGLFASLQQGLKPDTPSPKGAISRVVSKVKIYQ